MEFVKPGLHNVTSVTLAALSFLYWQSKKNSADDKVKVRQQLPDPEISNRITSVQLLDCVDDYYITPQYNAQQLD